MKSFVNLKKKYPVFLRVLSSVDKLASFVWLFWTIWNISSDDPNQKKQTSVS